MGSIAQDPKSPMETETISTLEHGSSSISPLKHESIPPLEEDTISSLEVEIISPLEQNTISSLEEETIPPLKKKVIHSLGRLSTSFCRDPPEVRDGTVMLDESPASTETASQDKSSKKGPLENDDVDPMALVTFEPGKNAPHYSKTSGQEIVVKEKEAMRKGFDHCFVNVPCKERLSVLFATLRRSSERKVIVICSTWESSKFHAVMFRQLEMLRVYELAENMEDVARAYDKFLYQYPGILFASDIAMREFEIPPNVDYVIQYEPSTNPTEYIYRMSNANIYDTSCHKALLFLTPEELHFLKCFDPVESKELEARKVSEFQASVVKLVAKHPDLNDLAWNAFRSFMIAYENHSHCEIYDCTRVDENVVCRSFGQPHLPGYGHPAEKKKEKKREKKRDSNSPKGGDNKSWKELRRKESGVDKDEQGQKPHAWMKGEKSFRRKDAVPWTTREDKTWKSSHTHH